MAGRQPLPDLHPENKGALGPFRGLPACPRSAVMAQPSSIFSFVHSLFILKHTFILEGDADVHNVVTLIRWLCLLSLQPCFNKSRVHPRSLPLPVVRGLCRLGGRARAGHNAFCVQTRNLGLEGLLPGARPGLCMVGGRQDQNPGQLWLGDSDHVCGQSPPGERRTKPESESQSRSFETDDPAASRPHGV